MKAIICYEDNEGQRHNTPQEAATADRIIAMRRISKDLVNEWSKSDYGSWQPGIADLSVILQRIAKSKGFAVLRKVQKIQRKEARTLAARDDIPF